MMRRILTLLLLLILAAPASFALTNYSENFEAQPVLGAPDADFYDFTAGAAGGTFVSSTRSLGTKSLILNDNSAVTTVTSTLEFDPFGVDLCVDGYVGGVPTLSFAMNFDDLPSSSSVTFKFQSTTAAGQATELSVSSTGVLTVSSGASSVAFSSSIVADTWYNVTASFICAPTSLLFNVGVVELNDAKAATATGAGACDPCTRDKLHVEASTTGTSKLYIDNLALNNVNDPPPTAVGSSATAAVTDLVGFDVDLTGSGLIARTNAGDFIRSYAPKTLTQLGSRDTNCNDPDMVATSDRANVYVVCDSGTNNPAFFSIRAFDDSTYDFPGNCDPGDDCLADIPIDGSPCSGFDDDQVLGQIEDLVHIPLDYSYITQAEPLVDDARAIAIAYSTTNGFVGVWEFTTRTGLDACNEERIAFAGSAPEQICVWQPDPEDDITLIGAVDSGGATKIYEYQPALDADTLDGTFGLRTTLSPTGGVAISCAEDKVLIVTNADSSNVHLIDIDDGTEVSGFPLSVAGEATRGAVLTGNANFFFVVDSTVMKLGYANNATIFGALTLPSGTFKGAGATFGGQDSWIATTTTIAYYDTFTAFPTEIGSGCAPSCDEDPTVDPTGPLFENAGSSIATALGITTFGGNLFMGAITIALVAVGMGGAPLTQRGGSFNLTLSIIGAILGFLIAWGFGFFTTAAVVSLVVLCIIGLGVKFWLGRGSSG